MKGVLEFGLSNLKITAYKDRERHHKIGGMRVMYNPESLDLRYDIDYDADNYLNGSVSKNHFKQARPGALQLELLFDASLPGSNRSVESQLAQLQLMCCEVNPGTKETPYLKIEWGKLHWNGKDYFSGRLSSLQVRYTRFDRKGTPLRATAHLTLEADESEVLSKAELGKLASQKACLSVPDMSFLPMLAAATVAVAGMAGAYDYLALAMANDLDSLDAIEPGDTLVLSSADEESEVQS